MNIKRVLVTGATGKTGRIVMRDLQDRGLEPVAMVRADSDLSVLPEGVETRAGDLADLDPGVATGMDAVIFAAGSGSGTGQDMTDRIDRDGAKALVDAARDAGASRFVMLSSIGADQDDPQGDLAHYLRAKHEADEYLKASGLPYAILRPVALTDDARTGDIRLGDDVDPKAEARRSDVAFALAEAAATGRLDGHAVNMQTA